MSDRFAYLVLGAGRQGAAAAYDMARWGDASRVILADRDLDVARKAAGRVNSLTGAALAEAQQVDVTNPKSLRQAMSGIEFDACHNTMQAMAKKLGHMPAINPAATVVPAGVVRIGELEQKGFSYIKP